ncbi:MAG: hypothetical protein Q8940_02255 [Bacteroidota bacterium]|nr:hypothetical protein [Bacteroidota bacterium]
MKCEFCNSEIVSCTEIEENGHYFCSSLHLYNWENINSDNASTQPNINILSKTKDVKPSKGKSSISKYFTIFCVVVGSSLGPYLFKYSDNLFGGNNKVDPEVMQLASSMNKSLPIMVDAVTRLDNVMPLPGKKIIYNYTLVSFSRKDFDTTLAQSQIRPRVINLYKISPDFKPFRDYGMNVICTYRYMDGTYAMQMKINAEDYK